MCAGTAIFKHREFRAYTFIALGVFLVAGTSVRGDWLSLQQRIVDIFAENKNAIVRVKAAYGSGVEDGLPQVVIGTGFFISKSGLILTNSSIAYDPLRVWIEHQGVSYAAEIVGADRSANLALLQLATIPKDFSFLHLVDSADLPKVGELVVRLSMPLDFDVSPKFGMITGFESRFGGSFFPCKYIRTSIDGAPGEGGAAYLDLSGRLVGMQVGGLPEVESTYVLPARAALRIRDDLLNAGEVEYGWIGFEVREESTVAEGHRLILAEVMGSTPAAAAGLRAGDILDKIGEYPVRSVDDLRNAMFYTRVGQYVVVTVIRGSGTKDFSVRLEKRPDNEPLTVLRTISRSIEAAISPMEDRMPADAEPLESPLLPKSRMAPEPSTRGDIPMETPRK